MSQEKAPPIRMYSLECPYRHPTQVYKTAIEKEDIRVSCVKCGASPKVTEIKE
jgi:hypothetical protein